MTDIQMLVAVSENNVIGINGRLPWHLKDDLLHFKETTINGIVVFGRKTFDSIGNPLPKRTNVILTRNSSFRAKDCRVFHKPEHILTIFKDHTFFIIGGQEIYEAFMPYARKLIVTHVETTINGDKFFPEIKEEDGWTKKFVKSVKRDLENDYSFSIYEYLRRPPSSVL